MSGAQVRGKVRLAALTRVNFLKNRFDVAEGASGILAMAALLLNIGGALHWYSGITEGEWITISILLVFPGLLVIHRRLVVSEISSQLATRLTTTLHSDNASIWNAYRQALELPHQRGTFRLVNGYYNILGQGIVTSEDDRAFYSLLAKRISASRALGGHMTVRLVLNASVPGILEYAREKKTHFSDAGVSEDFQIRLVDSMPPFDILVSPGSTIVLDIPEVYGDPVQGTGIEVREGGFGDALADWFDANLWEKGRECNG